MYCPHCGQAITPDARFCSACGANRVPFGASAERRIVRPRSPRLIAGVCSGFALHYGWNIAVTRILCVVLTCFTSGIGILFYIAAWVILPDAQYALPGSIPYQPQTGAQNSR